MKRSLNSQSSILNSRVGFTLIELLLFSAIFSMAMIAFITILVSITRVQVRQTAVAAVNQESQFILQTVQRYVEQSSAVDMTTDASGASLKLRMASATDPTYVYLSSGVVYLKETDAGTPQPLTSPRVIVSDLAFAKHENGAGHHSVSVSFMVQYNSTNVQQQFSQALNTAIARVSAATFDSSIVPAINNTWRLGNAPQDWQSINQTIYFSNGNVGISALNPTQALEVNGGIRINTVSAKPTCDASTRGTFWVTQSGIGVKDSVEVCVKNASDNYIWYAIY